VDAVSLNGFIACYQTVIQLKIGELGAIPIMLRLALIENLPRVVARLAVGCQDRDLAVDWAEWIVRVVEQIPTDLILVMADMARVGGRRLVQVLAAAAAAAAKTKDLLHLRHY